MVTIVNDQQLPTTLAERLTSHQFCCLGAAHTDHIMTLAAPARYQRTNPVSSYRIPGGVALNIAVGLRLFDLHTTLCSAPPPRICTALLRKLGINRRNLPAPRHDSCYIAVINNEGDLELGLAAMESYERIDAEFLTADFPFCQDGTVIIDAAFTPDLIAKAAQVAKSSTCMLVGAGTSPAKVNKLAAIKWDLFVLNEAEAAALLGDAQADHLAIKLAGQTGGAVAVTCGAQGAFLAIDDQLLRQAPPPFSSDNPNGAGDIFTAALTGALAAQMKPPAALRLATAAATATIANPARHLPNQSSFKRRCKSFAAMLTHSYRHTPQGMRLKHGSWQTIRQDEYSY